MAGAGASNVRQEIPIQQAGNFAKFLADGEIADSGVGSAGDIVAGTSYTLATTCLE